MVADSLQLPGQLPSNAVASKNAGGDLVTFQGMWFGLSISAVTVRDIWLVCARGSRAWLNHMQVTLGYASNNYDQLQCQVITVSDTQIQCLTAPGALSSAALDLLTICLCTGTGSNYQFMVNVNGQTTHGTDFYR